MHARVRQTELRAVDDLFVVEQQVEIQRARRVVKITTPAKVRFDRE